MGQRNLAPGFAPAQSQSVEQQKAICQKKKKKPHVQSNAISPFWLLSDLHLNCCSSRGGDAPLLVGCPPPGKQENWCTNMSNRHKKPDYHSGNHFVLSCPGWKCKSYIEGLKTHRKKRRQRKKKKGKERKVTFISTFPGCSLVVWSPYCMNSDLLAMTLLRLCSQTCFEQGIGAETSRGSFPTKPFHNLSSILFLQHFRLSDPL